MSVVKLTMKLRSITYPTYQNKNNKSNAKKLQRMNSFEFDDDAHLISTKEGTIQRRRGVSAEGRSRATGFRDSSSHSTDTTTSTLSSSYQGSRQGSLRQSKDSQFSFSETEVRCLCSDLNPADRGGPDETSPSYKRTFVSSSSSSSSSSRSHWDRSPSRRRILEHSSSNTERLLDWRRKSPERGYPGRSHSYDAMPRHYRSPERKSCEGSYCVRRRRLCTSTSVPPPVTKSHSTDKCPKKDLTPTVTVDENLSCSSEGRRGRHHFRRALSLFAISCHGKDSEKHIRDDKSPKKRLLRPPTRHVYRRGLSGLPIQCTSNSLGLAY